MNDYTDQLLTGVRHAEELWPHNAHLLEHPRIENYVRLVLRDREDFTIDGPALITPVGLGDRSLDASPTVANVASYPVSAPDEMLAKMDYVVSKGLHYGPPGFICASCTHPIPGGYGDRQFAIMWVSAPPSIVGIALCPSCAPSIVDNFKPVRI